MGLNKYTYTPADALLTGFASNVTGASFTLTATEATDLLSHRVSIRNDSATDHSGKTVTLVGTDTDGYALTEVMTGPTGSATVTSTGYFKTLTSATPSATIGADTFDIGWVDEFCSKTYPLNWRSSVAALLHVNVTGTIDFTAQETYDEVLTSVPRSPVQNSGWVSITALTTKTADTTANATVLATGVRLIANSYSSGALMTLNLNETIIND